jgi:ribonuclease HI
VRILQSKEAIGRITQWTVEISQYDVEFISRRAIKSQVLTDFIAEWTDSGAGTGVMLISPEGEAIKYAIQLEFPATNNIIEYEGLVNGLQLAKDLSIRRLLIKGDSHLVAKQVHKEYDCNNDMMTRYLAEVRRMEKFFDGLKYGMSHI